MLRLQKIALLLAAVFFVAANCDETDSLDSSLAVPFKVVDYFFSSLFKNLHDEPEGLEALEATESPTTHMATTTKASSTVASVRRHMRHRAKHHGEKKHSRIILPTNSTENVLPRKHIK